MRTIWTDGIIVTPDALLEGMALVLEDDRIAAIDAQPAVLSHASDAIVRSARGAYIMPGIIDTHTDIIRTLVQPRETALMDIEMAVVEADKSFASVGVTTVCHSWSFLVPRSGWAGQAIYDVSTIDRVSRAVRTFAKDMRMIRHRFHARYEVANVQAYDHLSAMIADRQVQLLSFMDHGAWPQDASPQRASHSMLSRLSDLARAYNVPLASHDDASPERLRFLREYYGVRISEFPINLQTARMAIQLGMTVTMGAPNLLLGRSHSGNLSAAEAIQDGCLSVLCSDYYPSSILHAVFQCAERGLCTLPQAVALATLEPAKSLGLEDHFGSIAAGKKADFLIVRIVNGMPRLDEMVVNGSRVLRHRYRGDTSDRPFPFAK